MRQDVLRAMHLHYGLEDAGWATVSLGCDGQRVEMAASNLHDSLRDLASAARRIIAGADEVRVVFMDEPGEHELILRRRGGDSVEMEVRWYPDWKSWKMYGGDGELRLRGSTTVARLRAQVLSELQRLLRVNGLEGYRERWTRHEFPADEMRELEGAG